MKDSEYGIMVLSILRIFTLGKYHKFIQPSG